MLLLSAIRHNALLHQGQSSLPLNPALAASAMPRRLIRHFPPWPSVRSRLFERTGTETLELPPVA